MTHKQSNTSEINEYYPFGLVNQQTSSTQFGSKAQNYKTTSKELFKEFNLEQLDFGARMYSPQIARWSVIDPLAPKFLGTSPYAYTMNNPVKFIDPNGMDVVNGHQADRDEALAERDKRKAAFDSKYSSSNLKRGDFSSRKEFRDYKSSRNGLANAESSYQNEQSKFDKVQEAIDLFKSVDQENFNKVDNLINAETGSKIDVIVKFGAVDPMFGGAKTGPDGPNGWPVSFTNQELRGDKNIHITFDGTSKLGTGPTIAHEFGHAFGIAQAPYETFLSVRSAIFQGALGVPNSGNCQHPDNRNETFVKPAMDWQDRFIQRRK